MAPRPRFVPPFLITILFGLICFGQQQPPEELVNGYPMLDAKHLYSPGEKVQVEEPHGVYSGLILMDDYYFLRPLRVSETKRQDNGV